MIAAALAGVAAVAVISYTIIKVFTDRDDLDGVVAVGAIACVGATLVGLLRP